jgi:hypothetical protein
LLRDNEDASGIFDLEDGRPRKKATVWRLMGLAKEEVWVRTFPLAFVVARLLDMNKA